MDQGSNVAKNSVEVVIAGEVVTLTGVESEEYIQRIARYIDKKIAEINRTHKSFSINSFLKTLLISVNIADDLFKTKEKNQRLNTEVLSAKKEIDKLQTRNANLGEKNKSLQEELANAQRELAECSEALQKSINESSNIFQLRNKNV